MGMKAIIFDIDNTLIDFMEFKRISCEAAVDAMKKAGLKMSKKDALAVIHRIYREDGYEDPHIFQKFLATTQGEVDYRKLAHAINAYRRARILMPYPGAKETLKKLKRRGIRLAVVSDAPKMKAWLRLTAIKLDHLFDVVVAHEDTGKHKPHAIPFQAALKALKVRPEDCLMVGDHPARDIKGAKALGMKTCLALYGLQPAFKGPKADYEISSIPELLDII